MKTLGIIGGIAPDSTIEYYRTIVALYRQRGDGSYPRIIINSIDLTKMVGLVVANAWDELAGTLLLELDKLARAGADIGLLAANTPHIVFDRLEAKSPLPLISIVEAASRAAEAAQLERVGLFGTRFTMQSQFYESAFARRGIALVVPEASEQDLIHTKYMGELINGQFLPETREQLLAIVERMRRDEAIQGLVLGGTELPLLLRDESWAGVRFLDTARIHAEQAVEQMLE